MTFDEGRISLLAPIITERTGPGRTAHRSVGKAVLGFVKLDLRPRVMRIVAILSFLVLALSSMSVSAKADEAFFFVQLNCSVDTIRVRQLLVWNEMGRRLRAAYDAGEITNILPLGYMNRKPIKQKHLAECEISTVFENEPDRFQLMIDPFQTPWNSCTTIPTVRVLIKNITPHFLKEHSGNKATTFLLDQDLNGPMESRRIETRHRRCAHFRIREIVIHRSSMSLIFPTYPRGIGGYRPRDAEVENWLKGIENDFIGEFKPYSGE